MNVLELIFWLAAACVLYTYVGYPILISLAARFFPAARIYARPLGVPVSVIVAVRDEERRIGERVRELAGLVASRAMGGEVIVVSDGSIDDTVSIATLSARESELPAGGRVSVKVVSLETHQGKAAALNAGWKAAMHPILVFADVRQTWKHDAIDWLVANFADPKVGAVSGELIVKSATGVMAGVGLYWRFEKWIRRAESRYRSMVSVTGSISAVRREFYRPIPVGTILDDVSWPLAVAMKGQRVVHEERAVAFDRLPAKAEDEFRRKVRTLSGNYQLIARDPRVLLPWRNPIWWQFLSHRVLRLIVPWALLAIMASNVMLRGTTYQILGASQAVFYMVGFLGFLPVVARKSRVASAVASFLLLNCAAWIGFWVWVSGRSSSSWTKARYQTPASNHDLAMIARRVESVSKTSGISVDSQ